MMFFMAFTSHRPPGIGSPLPKTAVLRESHIVLELRSVNLSLLRKTNPRMILKDDISEETWKECRQKVDENGSFHFMISEHINRFQLSSHSIPQHGESFAECSLCLPCHVSLRILF